MCISHRRIGQQQFLRIADRFAKLFCAQLDDALAWARGKGAKVMFLSVWENNLRAQAFYKRYGFEHVKEHKFMVGRIADRDFIWRLAL